MRRLNMFAARWFRARWFRDAEPHPGGLPVAVALDESQGGVSIHAASGAIAWETIIVGGRLFRVLAVTGTVELACSVSSSDDLIVRIETVVDAVAAEPATVDVVVCGGSMDVKVAQLLPRPAADLSAAGTATLQEFVVSVPPVGASMESKVVVTATSPPKVALRIRSLAVCPAGDVSRTLAATHREWRTRNEIAHFASLYRDDFYRERQWRGDVDSGGRERRTRTAPAQTRDGFSRTSIETSALRRLDAEAPQAGENAFSFAHRLLGLLLPHRRPDFAARLTHVSERLGRHPRVLSLCCGAAGIESMLVRASGVPVDLTLCDINPSLLEEALKAFPTSCNVETRQLDVNALPVLESPFDIVICVSGLHHLVHLEQTLAAAARSLGPGGEFWAVGEQVGRNGSRLWPESYAVANALFISTPERYRVNRVLGGVDAQLPNGDCSSSTFEGIRSEDILRVLDRHFLPVHVYVRNCFLWRLVDMAYASNFDLAVVEDVALLKTWVVAEFVHWVEGANGTELHGIFESRWGAARSRLAGAGPATV